MDVFRVLIRRRLRRLVGPFAALDAPRVVGDDRSIGEVPGEGAEPGGAMPFRSLPTAAAIAGVCPRTAMRARTRMK